LASQANLVRLRELMDLRSQVLVACGLGLLLPLGPDGRELI
jgi:hypothetical protein